MKTSDTQPHPFRKNIFLMCVINFLSDFRLYAPLAVIFYGEISGSFALGMGVFSVVTLATTLSEIPTGLISDRVGRKMTLILGCIFSSAAVLGYALSGSFPFLCLAAALEGIARAFFSGNNTALLFDSVRAAEENAKDQDFHTILGKVGSFFQFALSISALAGGILAGWAGMRITFLVTLPFQLLTIPLALLITEPPSGNEPEAGILETLKKALALFREKRSLRRIALANIVSDAGGEAGYQFQAAFFQLLWPVWAIGLARTLSNLGGALSFWFSGGLINRFGKLPMMMASRIYGRVMHIIALVFPNPASPLLVSSTSLFYGVSVVSAESLYQEQFSDSVRATMGSAVSFAGSLIFGVYAVLLGLLADRIGPIPALLASQFVMLIPIVILGGELRGVHGTNQDAGDDETLPVQ